MHSWYDIYTMIFNNVTKENIHEHISVPEVLSNSKRIKSVIKNEINILGGKSNRVFLAGFS